MKRLILGLFVVFGMAVSGVNGIDLFEGEQKTIDELKVRYEEWKKNTGKTYKEDVEKFLAFVEFYKSYKGGKYDGYEAWKAALKENEKYKRIGEYSKMPYELCGASLSNSNNYDFKYCVNWLFKNMREDEINAGAVRLNKTGSW